MSQPTIYINESHLGDYTTTDTEATLRALRDALRERGHNVEIGAAGSWPGEDEWPDRPRFEREWDNILDTVCP